MKNENNLYLFNHDWRNAFLDYSPDERCAIYEAIMDYAHDGTVPSDRFLKAVTANARIIIDRNKDKYQERCEKNRENARKRWERSMQLHAVDAKHAYNDSDSDSDSDITPITNVTGDDIEKEKTSKEVKKKTASTKNFKKPTPDEVQAYCDERGNGYSGQHFCDYYESKGWKIGNSPMKDWKAAVRTWEQRDPAHKPSKVGKQAQPNCKLGVGEFIAQDGTRRYGTGNLPPVPMDAPPRPDDYSLWSRETNTWIPYGV